MTSYIVRWNGVMDRLGTCFSLLGDRRSESSLGPQRTLQAMSSGSWLSEAQYQVRVKGSQAAAQAAKAKRDLVEQVDA